MKEELKDWADEESPHRSIFEASADGMIVSEISSGLVVRANSAAAEMHGYALAEFIGLHPTAFMDAQSHHLLAEYAQTAQAGRVFEAEALHVRKDGTSFHVEWRGTAFTHQGHTYLLGTLRDITQQINEERMLRKWVEERAHEQNTLLEISQELATTVDLKPRFILNHFRDVIEYNLAGYFTLDEPTLTVVTTYKPQEAEQAPPFSMELDNPTMLTSLFNKYRPIRIADVNGTEPAAEFLRFFLKDEAAVLLEGIRSWMWVPLAVKRRFIGIVGLAHSEPDYFKEHQADLALTLANHAATTLANVELYEDAQALAVLQERQRLARNLHDAVNQSLFSASLIAEVLPRLWERDPEEARHSIEDLRKLTRGAISEMRMLVAELRPLALADSNMNDLFHQLANAFTGRTNIPVAVTIKGDDTIRSEVQVALYRICQEALNNIVKHAGASRVKINLQYKADEVEMHIHDNGRGFDPNLALPGHYGLSMMHERAHSVGAELDIVSRPGEGTEIILRWLAESGQENNEKIIA
jgi:PAS domain S-box-containing protein